MDTKKLALNIRKNVIRMTHQGNSSHVASALSIADILAMLYGKVMRYDCQNPHWDERDRFILSKGHAGSAVYAALAECGFFPHEKLNQHCQDGSNLSGHVSHKGIPGVEVSTGSLGHGLSIGAGMAYAAKRKNTNYKVYVLLSDGECDEGSNWETILFAAHHRLHNLIAIVDYNKLQSIKPTAETLNLEPFVAKWESFGWSIAEVDGHDHQQLQNALQQPSVGGEKPRCILAHTTKGKGISFMENQVAWHYRSPQGNDYVVAMQELENMT
jgi:transketolase